MAPGGEIIIYAPHINYFHSRPEMDLALRQIGYHCKDYVKKYLEQNPDFSKNIAAHVINVRGAGSFDVNSGKEKFDFKVTLATGISQEVCESVGLGYRNHDSFHKENFIRPEKLWIQNGGKYLYKIK